MSDLLIKFFDDFLRLVEGFVLFEFNGKNIAGSLFCVQLSNVVRKVNVCFLGVLSIGNTCADTLVLDNGDRISGELLAMSEGALTWKSEKFGDITVKNDAIALIETQGKYQISLNENISYSNCSLSYIGELQTMVCNQQIVNISDWTLISNIGTVKVLEQDVTTTTGDTVVGLEQASGNLEQEGYDLVANLLIEHDNKLTERTQHKFTAEYDSRKTDNIRTKGEGRVAYQHNAFFTDVWFFKAGVAYEKYEVLNMEERQSSGIGVGLEFINTDTMKLSIESGVDYIKEYYMDSAGQEFNSLSWELNYTWGFLNSGSEFFHKHSFWQSFKQSDDWEWKSETGISVPINGHFKSILKLEYDYRNLPANNDKSHDSVWSLGFGYNW